MLLPLNWGCKVCNTSVSLQIIGSGAADHDWANIGQDGVRGSACTLLNGHILLDAGVTAAVNLNRFGVAPDVLTDLLVTHTHIDHFDPRAIGKILAAPGVSCPPAIPIVLCGEQIGEREIGLFEYYGIEKLKVVK